MNEAIEKTIEAGKVWGIKIVMVVTILTTIYTSLFQPEHEAREYYGLMQPAITEALDTTNYIEENTYQNSLEIAKLKGLIDGLQSCGKNKVFETQPMVLQKPQPSPPTTKSKRSLPEKPQERSRARKTYLPQSPWKQQVDMNQIDELVQQKIDNKL